MILRVYNAYGQEVAVLVNEKLPAGKHTVTWDASELPAGVYYYRLEIGDRRPATGKIVKY